MKVARIEVKSCERCPYVSGHGSMCGASQWREIQDTAEIPDWCPLSDAAEAKNAE